MSDFDAWWDSNFTRITRNRLSPAKEAWDHQQNHIEELEAAITNLRDGNEYILVRELRERIEELEPKAHQFDLLKESGTGIFNTEYVRKLEAVVKASKWYGVELDKVERELEERLNRK